MAAKYRLFLIPALIAFLMSSFYILVIPGGIGSDAKEYDDLANSIMIGQYHLNGAQSMEREPGYPFFRAVIKTVSSNSHTILWIQGILYALIVFLIGVASVKIDPKIGLWGAWGASLSYGLAFYPSTHLSEILTTFLLTLIGIFFIFALEKPTLKNFILISILGGILMLTRYTYVLVPIVCLVILTIISIKNKSNKKKIIIKLVLSFLIIFTIVSPWLIRNYVTFGEINVAGRSGAILYARSVQANNPWRSIPDSLLSVILGRGILFTIYPTNQSVWLEQWGDWWRNKETIKEMWHGSPVEIDKQRKSEALKFIFGSGTNFTKFILWSGINELRLLELPNPILEAYGSPFEGTYGPIAKEGKLSSVQLLSLSMVHLVQLLWFVAITASTYLGFKKYKLKFVPGIFLVCILLPHTIADNIARYGAPLQPWLLSAIFMTILFPIYSRFKEKKWKSLQ